MIRIINPPSATSEIFKKICCVALSIALYSGASAQTFTLNPELKGYGDCGLQNDPVLCLQNTIKAIDYDQGYYADYSENRKGQIKAEYCLQLSYVYRQMGDLDKSIAYLEEAGKYMSQMKVDNDDEMYSEYVVAKETFKEYADNIRNLPTDEMKRAQVMKDEVYVNGRIVHKQEEQKIDEPEKTYEELVENELLTALRSYLKQKPISESFFQKNASDSCVIEMKRQETATRSVLDTYVSCTQNMESIGMHLMGISKHLKNKGLIQSKVDMTIIIEPSTRDEIIMRDGRFYVYYAQR